MNIRKDIRDNLEYSNARFENETLSGVEVNAVCLDGCVFDTCDFSESSFVDCTFNNCSFVDCNLLLVKIPNTNFNTVKFERCDMIGIDWTVARWFRSTKKKKQIFPVLFESCRLNHSIFVGLNLVNAVFVDCIIKEAFFEDSLMEGCAFKKCDLENSIFKNTNLRGADLSTSKNYDIDACQNNVKKAKFSLPEAMSLIYSLDIEITDEE